MTDNINHILLFKTNINCPGDKLYLHTVLDCHTDIAQWTVDQEDEDCVLRIVSPILTHQQIIDLLNNHGYKCCELI